MATAAAVRRGGLPGLGLGALGGILLYRGLTKTHPLANQPRVKSETKLTSAVTIGRISEELYDFWHGFECLPRFMKYVREVYERESGRAHWVVQPAAGPRLEWDSEVTRDEPTRCIAWRSLPGGDIDNAGEVRFRPAPAGRGTVVELDLHYKAPGGVMSRLVDPLMKMATDEMLQEDLRRLKRVVESGEIPTNATRREAQGGAQ